MKKVLMFAAIASVMLASCSKETNHSAPTTAKNELGVTAGISGTVNTRAFKDGTAFANTDKIAVFVTGGVGATAYVPKVTEYTFDGLSTPNVWISPSLDVDKIFLSNVTGTVYGFYPSVAMVTAGTLGDNATIDIALPNTEASFNGTSQNDYMYAVPGYLASETGVSNKTDAEKVNLNFKHALAKVTFVVNKGQYYSGEGKLTEVELSKIGSFNAGTGTMAVKDGALNWGITPTLVDFISFTNATGAPINVYNATASTTPVVTGLVAPRADNTGIILTLTIDGKKMSVTLPISTTTPFVGTKWESGNNYRYVITVNSTELIVSQVTITDWIANEVGGIDIK